MRSYLVNTEVSLGRCDWTVKVGIVVLVNPAVYHPIINQRISSYLKATVLCSPMVRMIARMLIIVRGGRWLDY